MSSSAAIFFLLSCFLSLHACNGRILLAKDSDSKQGLGSEIELEIMGSRVLVPETASSQEASSVITEEHPILLQNGGCVRSHGNVGTPTVKERKLQEKNATAQEIESEDSDDVVEDAVVMDYTTPHRKPPIHNEEN